MDPVSIIKELGGGLSAVAIVAMALVIVVQYRKNERLIDKLLACSESGAEKTKEMHEKTLATVSALTVATQASNSTAQAAVNLLERERGQK